MKKYIIVVDGNEKSILKEAVTLEEADCIYNDYSRIAKTFKITATVSMYLKTENYETLLQTETINPTKVYRV